LRRSRRHAPVSYQTLIGSRSSWRQSCAPPRMSSRCSPDVGVTRALGMGVACGRRQRPRRLRRVRLASELGPLQNTEINEMINSDRKPRVICENPPALAAPQPSQKAPSLARCRLLVPDRFKRCSAGFTFKLTPRSVHRRWPPIGPMG
jgi:hypothetical protein